MTVDWQTTENAFTDLFRSMYPPLVRYAMRFNLSRQAADDVVQDVFLILWRDRRTIHVKVSLSALLYTMVRNRALNARRDGSRVVVDTDRATEDSACVKPGFDNALDAESLRRRLYAWIADLPTRRAEAFVLSRFHDLSHAEIAAVMGLSKRTVDTHILLALRELRVRLDRLQNQESEL